MLRCFQTNCTPTPDVVAPTRWRLDPRDVVLLNRIEQTAQSTIVAGYPPQRTKQAIVTCLRGVDVPLSGLSMGVRRSLPRLLDAIRDAATARIDAELIAAVCSDAMEVGRMLRAAYCEGLRDGAQTQPSTTAVQ